MLRSDKIIADLHRDLAEERGMQVTDKMIQAACVASYGVDSDKDSNLYKLMKRALAAALTAAQ